MVKLQIILGTTRPTRKSHIVGNWVLEQAKQRNDFEVELVDIADYNLPLLDEPKSALTGDYSKPHTQKWSKKIAEADGFIFVTAEYNHSMPAALKNAIDFLYAEWSNKAAGFVGYGVTGGLRAVEHLRGVMGQIKIADVGPQVGLTLVHDFENFSDFKPEEMRTKELNDMFDALVSWSTALKTVRE